jgi:hypothetical protein
MRKLVVTALGELADPAQDKSRSFGLLKPEQLTATERRFAERVWRLQKALTNGRFNVWGRIRKDGRPLIRLDTEFRQQLAAKAWWRIFRRRMCGLGLHVETLIEDTADGPPRSQVACWLDISKCSVAEARQERRRLVKGTQEFWQTHGIGVV